MLSKGAIEELKKIFVSEIEKMSLANEKKINNINEKVDNISSKVEDLSKKINESNNSLERKLEEKTSNLRSELISEFRKSLDKLDNVRNEFINRIELIRIELTDSIRNLEIKLLAEYEKNKTEAKEDMTRLKNEVGNLTLRIDRFFMEGSSTNELQKLSSEIAELKKKFESMEE